MTSDPSLSRRVDRLENDTESMYELLTEIKSTQGEHTRILDEHTRILDEHTRRFDRIDSTLEEVVRRLPEPS